MGTRPDIAFATSTVAQYSENPSWKHWEAVKTIFRYLLGIKNLQLTYEGEERDLVGYIDADGALQDHRRAISGYVFMADGGAVSWSSKKQELVTLSTMKAKYITATHAAKEAIWLQCLLMELFGSFNTQPHYLVIASLLFLLPTTVIIMPEPSTSIFGIILFAT